MEKTILIAEDDESTRRLYKKIFRPYHTILASNGKEALALSKEKKPDLLLTDIEMPEMSGLELIVAVQKDEELKRMPIIAISSNYCYEQETLKYGVGFIEKPVSVKYLLEKVEKALNNR